MLTLNHKEISTPKNCNWYLWFSFENVRRLSYYASLLSELWWWVQVWSFLFWSEIENEHLNISNRHWSDQFYKVVSRFHACSSFLIFFDRLIPILAVVIYHLLFYKAYLLNYKRNALSTRKQNARKRIGRTENLAALDELAIISCAFSLADLLWCPWLDWQPKVWNMIKWLVSQPIFSHCRLAKSPNSKPSLHVMKKSYC